MSRARALRARERLLSKLPVTGELLRGSLLERTIRHTKDCPKCARGTWGLVSIIPISVAGRVAGDYPRNLGVKNNWLDHNAWGWKRAAGPGQFDTGRGGLQQI